MTKSRVPLHEKLLWSSDEVAGAIGISRSTLYARLQTDPSFPRPQALGGRKLWRAADVRAWVEALYASEAS